MNLIRFFINNWLMITQYELANNTAFVGNIMSPSNQTQASYLVYTKGEIQFNNLDDTFSVTRSAFDSTDSSVITDMPTVMSVEAIGDSEFFCLMKVSREKVERIEHKLNAGDSFTSSHDTVFVAVGTVTINGEEVQAPKLLENINGVNIQATQRSFVIEVA